MKIVLLNCVSCLISSHFYVCKFDREHEEKEEKLIEFSFGILNSSMWWKAMTCGCQ